MRKTKGGEKENAWRFAGKELGSGLSHDDLRNTHTSILTAHTVVYSWFLFGAVKEKQHPASDVKQL